MATMTAKCRSCAKRFPSPIQLGSREAFESSQIFGNVMESTLWAGNNYR